MGSPTAGRGNIVVLAIVGLALQDFLECNQVKGRSNNESLGKLTAELATLVRGVQSSRRPTSSTRYLGREGSLVMVSTGQGNIGRRNICLYLGKFGTSSVSTLGNARTVSELSRAVTSNLLTTTSITEYCTVQHDT
jgi:hypothetical protein